jgi:hypothetical protein
MVTDEDAGITAGALYSPLAEMVPDAEFPPGTPFTLHITCVLLLPETTAVYCALAPSVMLFAPVRVRVTLGGGGGGGGAVNATLMLCEIEGSARLVAVMVTTEDEGALAGAL